MTRSAGLAWAVTGLTFVLLALGASLMAATWSTTLSPLLVPRGVNFYAAPVFAAVGALLVIRVPHNGIGYVLLYTALGGSVQLVSEQVAYAAEVWPVLTPLAPWGQFVYYGFGTVLSLPPPLYLLALFPSGRLSNERERRAVIAGTIACVGVTAAGITLLENFPEPFSRYANPFGQPELARVMFAIGIPSFAVYVVALGVVLQGLIQRFRRSTGIERQQLKWFAFAAATTAVVVAGFWVTLMIAFAITGRALFDSPPDAARTLIVLMLPVFDLLPIAVAIAVLRYRLYDIDLIINRTVLYVSVTAILATGFAVSSALAQRLVESATGQRSDLVTVGLAVALLLGFDPLRRRIRPLVDRVLPPRGLLTLLFTDIVGSTERIVALGDERWRAVLKSYRATVRRELARFGGREVDTAGDGFFATFERPSQALRCATALRTSLRDLGLDSRIGLHTGECELRGERVSGLNVVVAARIMATARANEIVISSAVRDLVADTSFRFRDGAVESLKGVPGEWRLNFVDDAPMPA